MSHADLTGQCVQNLVWQWGANMASCFQSLIRAKSDPGSALPILLDGQRHNPSVQDLYKTTIASLGTDAFWTIVATASYQPANVAWALDLFQRAFDAGDKDLRDALFSARNAYLGGDWWSGTAWIQFLTEKDDEQCQILRASVNADKSQIFGKIVELFSH